MDHDRHAHPRTIADLLTARTRSAGHRPLLTCYDDTVGARTELSYATLDNWAAKTANLLAEACDVSPGDTVGIDLDGHWTAAAVLLACWRVGAGVVVGAPGVVTFCHQQRLDAYGDRPVVVVGDGLAAEPTDPVAQRAGLLVLADEVHAFADDHDDTATAASPALVVAGTHLDHTALLDRSTALGARIGDAGRVALALPLDDPSAIAVLVAVLLRTGSLVCTRGSAHTADWQRLTTERATVVAGPAAALDAAGPPPAGITRVEIDADADASPAGAGA